MKFTQKKPWNTGPQADKLLISVIIISFIIFIRKRFFQVFLDPVAERRRETR